MKRKTKTIASILMTLAVIVSISLNTMTALAAGTNSYKTVLVSDNGYMKTSVTYYTGDATSPTSSGMIDRHVTGSLDYWDKRPRDYHNYVYWVLDENGTLYVSAKNDPLSDDWASGAGLRLALKFTEMGKYIKTFILTDCKRVYSNLGDIELTCDYNGNNGFGVVRAPNLTTVISDSNYTHISTTNCLNLNNVIIGTDMEMSPLQAGVGIKTKQSGGYNLDRPIRNIITISDEKPDENNRICPLNTITGRDTAIAAIQKLAPTLSEAAQDFLPVELGGRGIPAPVNHTGVIGFGGQPIKGDPVAPAKPAAPAAPAAPVISNWAKPQVDKAVNNNLVPEDKLNKDYTKPITRGEFAALAVNTYEAATGKTATCSSAQFADGNNQDMAIMYELGVIGGYNKADNQAGVTVGINDPITREQAAVILAKLAAVTGKSLAAADTVPFTDNISDWAMDGVSKVYNAGIMSGYDTGAFGSKDSYTTEQSIVTMLRTFELAQ